MTANAWQRCNGLGIGGHAWADLTRIFGRSGAAVKIFIADMDGGHRVGQIHNVGGWVQAMSVLAAQDQARIHRSVFGLIHAEKDFFELLEPSQSTINFGQMKLPDGFRRGRLF